MLTQVWGPLAPIISYAISFRPEVAARLALAPVWIIHAVAAFVHAKVVSGRSQAGIADALADQSARDLLAEALPNEHQRFRSVLRRLGPRVQESDFYERLNAVLHGPAAAIVADVSLITPILLEAAELVANDPVLLAAGHAVRSAPSNVQPLQAVLAYARFLGLANRIESLPQGSGWKAILARFGQDLGDAPALPAPFAIPTGWHQVRTLRDLFEVGRAMENCVAKFGAGGDHHFVGLLRGSSIHLARNDEPALLTIVSVGPCAWAITEFAAKGAKGAWSQVRDGVVEELEEAAEAAGHRLFATCPISTLGTFAWLAEHRNSQGDLDDAQCDGVE